MKRGTEYILKYMAAELPTRCAHCIRARYWLEVKKLLIIITRVPGDEKQQCIHACHSPPKKKPAQ